MEFLGSLYETIYLLMCTLMFFSVIKHPVSVNSNGTFSIQRNNLQMYGFIFVLIIYIGIRPMTQHFGDTLGYYELYEYIFNNPFVINPDTENLIFDNLLNFFASIGLPYTVFLTFISAIYFTCITFACNKLFKSNGAIATMSYLVAFSTYSYSTNGFKAGSAAAIFLVALAYKDKVWLMTLLAIISIGFHHSMKVPVAALLVSFFYRNTKMYFYLWGVGLLMAILHIGAFQELFANYGTDQENGYLRPTGDVVHLTGFRPDFVLYSAVPVYVGYIMFFKKHIIDKGYELLLRVYLMTNTVWMLCMYANFTNRIAYLSWLMLPLVLLYPYYVIYTSGDQLLQGTKVAKYHLYFTLFMVFIYYGLLSWHH